MILKLNNVRLAFPDLFVPRAFEDGQDKKYGATLLIPKGSENDKAIRAAINTVAKDKWKEKASTVIVSCKDNPNKCAYQDGDKKAALDGYEGMMSLAAKNAARPTVVDRNRTPLTADDGKPYSGCYVNANIEVWVQDNKWGKGIRATLRGVQFHADGDAFTGGTPASADEFDDLSVGADAMTGSIAEEDLF